LKKLLSNGSSQLQSITFPRSCDLVVLQLVFDVAKLRVELILLGVTSFAQLLIADFLNHRRPVLISVSAFRSLLAV
jgi:hypothetical protein